MDKTLGKLGSYQSRFHKKPVGLAARFGAFLGSDSLGQNISGGRLAYYYMRTAGRVTLFARIAITGLIPSVVMAQSSPATMKAVLISEYGGAEVDELAEIGKSIDKRKIKVIVSLVFAFAKTAKAQEQVATGHTRGEIVPKVADEPK